MYCPACGKDNLEDSQFCGICGVPLIASTASGIGTAASEVSKVSFPQAVKLGFKNYFKFSGRATRAEYWWWFLFTVLIGYGLDVIDNFTGSMGYAGPSLLGVLFKLSTIVPSFALGVRRLHDINRTGWWLLVWGFFPMAAIGIGILLVSFLVLDNLLMLTVIGFATLIGFGILGIIGVIITIVWAIKKGDYGLNKYGLDPRQPTSQRPYKP
jgi:uncharacterized membrane protein YhaH (DUF805 family)